MQRLSNTLTQFKPPKLAQERIVEIGQWEAEQSKLKQANRLRAAGIPTKFARADISACLPEVQAYAKDVLSGSSDWLILRGQVGRGKTYSACAVMRAAIETMRGRFTTAVDMLNAIRATYDSKDSESTVRSAYSNVPLLVIDDFGKEKPTEWMLSTLFTILDERYRSCRPTIITTQYTGRELIERLTIGGDNQTAKAIISRLSEGMPVVLEGPDRRLQK